MRISDALFTLVVPLGAVLIFANLSGDGAKATRQFIVAQLAPVGALVDEARNVRFFSRDAQGSPTSAFDVFAGKDDVDYDFVACIKASGSDVSRTLMGFLSMRDHKTVANVASCFISANRPALCKQAGRSRVAAMMEAYLWARQHALKHKAEGLDTSRVAGDGRADDPGDEIWDGPDDRAVFSALKGLALDGYISLDDFGWFPRAEIRQALADVVVARRPCLPPPVGAS